MRLKKVSDVISVFQLSIASTACIFLNAISNTRCLRKS